MAEVVIAIDGPAGSGKSSVSKAAARELGFGYLDTGAGYRAFAIHKSNFPGLELDRLIGSFDYSISIDPDSELVMLAGVDVTAEIRTAAVSEAVSAVAKEQLVRNLQLQDAKKRINDCLKRGIIVEGRDITTVVAPQAILKVLLTASPSVRLERRGLDGTEPAGNILKRDLSDGQIVDFITPGEGVSLLDTTEMDFQRSVAALVKMIRDVNK
ncbi:(d)CMP kinase [Aquiluna sp. Uisw_065]|uniref:(d)CMP kinase n=1 Tax=Aquiluna sp. Uisw_065 TaxID=3230967 RepID=UPI0039E9DD32